MKILPDWIKTGYLRLIDPVANWLVKRGVHPNTITCIGTLCTLVGGIIYGTGHIKTGGWFLGVTALCLMVLLLAALAIAAAPSLASAAPAKKLEANLRALWTTVFQTPNAQNPFGAGGAGSGCFSLELRLRRADCLRHG